MKLGKIIGTVVSTQTLECFEGIKLLLIQQIDEHGEPIGVPIVGMDVVQAGEGDTVFYESSKEAGQALKNWFHPGDVAIMGIVDHVDTIEKKSAEK